MNPIISRRKKSQTVISSSVNQDSDFIPVQNADTYFCSGDLIFISKPDDSDLECLGTVVAVFSTHIKTTFALAASKPNQAKIWKSSSFFKFLVPVIIPIQIKLDTGVTQTETIGGAVYNTKTAEKKIIESLKFEAASKKHFESFIAWIDSQTYNGLYPFTYISPNREVSKVCLIPNKTIFTERLKGMFEMTLELQILNKGVYE